MAAVLPVISERRRVAPGCRAAVVEPDLSGEHAGRLALSAKALADPTRLQIIDALRKASPRAICQCELLPLFDISQAALAKHLKLLVAAELIAVERRGLWAFYYANPDALTELRLWLS